MRDGLWPELSQRSAPCSRTSCIAAVAAGDVDVISAYSSDGRIAKYDLKVLADPKQAIPPYDAIVLLAPKRADDEQARGPRSSR